MVFISEDKEETSLETARNEMAYCDFPVQKPQNENAQREIGSGWVW